MRPLIACIAIMAAAIATARAVDTKTFTLPGAVQDSHKLAAVLWADCLGEGGVAILRPDSWTCVDPAESAKQVEELDPTIFNARACDNGDDKRRGTSIRLLYELNTLAERGLQGPQASKILKSGIHLVGGLFCDDELDLPGLAPAAPLALDSTVFKYGKQKKIYDRVNTIGPPQGELTNPESVAHALWSGCLDQGRQAVLYPDKWLCMDRADGERQLAGLGAEDFDLTACDNTKDLRRMPTGVLQKLKDKVKSNSSNQTPYAREIRNNGIRLIGGLFCQDEVDLSSFRLDAPLVLDRGVFKFGVRATKELAIAGNLSFAHAYVYDNLALTDAKINGTLFGNDSFIERTQLIGTTILDHLRLDNAILLDYVNLIHVKVGRGINLGDSKLSALNMRQGQVVERLNLDGAEAACKFVIEDPDINELWADGTGFGTTIANPKKSSAFRRWNEPTVHPKMRYMPTVQKRIGDLPNCDSEEAQFIINGGSIHSGCILHFKWSAPGDNTPLAPTTLSLDRLTVGDSLLLNLWPKEVDVPKPVRVSDRKLSLVNTKIATLFFDFRDNNKPYQTSIDGLAVDRVYTTQRKNAGGKAATQPGQRKHVGCAARPNEAERELPNSALVLAWLKKNTTGSLQPYLTFTKAFENAGADTTDLKIAKAQFEYEQNYNDYQNSLSQRWETRTSLTGFVGHYIVDHLAFGSRWLLGLTVDFGYRPAQVIWIVVMIIALSCAAFWWALRIVAFSPPDSNEVYPIGPVFLFDWLLPLYKLRDEHSKIGKFYRKGSGSDAQTVQRFGKNVQCVEATPGWARAATVYLDILKVLGVILAAFLIAAVNALIAH